MQLAQHVTTGITSMLQSVRVQGFTAPIGTHVTAEIQGTHDPAGAPDGHTIASGTATVTNGGSNFTQTVPLGSPMLFAADEPFALVFSADQTSTVRPQALTAMAAETATSLAPWQTLKAVDGRYDIPFATVVTPLRVSARYRRSAVRTRRPCLRNGPAATNGKIPIVGGHNVQSAELYDPATGTSTPTGSMNVARRDHTATLLTDGTVLIAGGWNQPNNSPQTYLSTAELYHPDTGTFELLPGDVEQPRVSHGHDTRQRTRPDRRRSVGSVLLD